MKKYYAETSKFVFKIIPKFTLQYELNYVSTFLNILFFITCTAAIKICYIALFIYRYFVYNIIVITLFSFINRWFLTFT